MTATTPPITAWYVLEVEGTGLASAQTAKGEKTERRRRCGPCYEAEAAARPVDAALGGPDPAQLGATSSVLLPTRAVEAGARERRQRGKRGAGSDGRRCQLR